MTPDKEAILKLYVSCTCSPGFKSRDLDDPDCPLHSFGEQIMDAMEAYSASQNEELRKENEIYKKGIEFYRESTSRCREFVFGDKEIGYPGQPIWDAVYDKLIQLQSTIDDKEKQLKESLLLYQNMCEQISKDQKEIERLKGLIESLHTDAFGIAPHKWQQFKTENHL